MTILGVLVLFVGLNMAGAGAGLALFRRLPARGTLRLMAIGTGLGALGLVLTVLSADEGESLSAGTFVPLIIVIAVVAYAAWYARSNDPAP
jgi:hypothetical protein